MVQSTVGEERPVDRWQIGAQQDNSGCRRSPSVPPLPLFSVIFSGNRRGRSRARRSLARRSEPLTRGPLRFAYNRRSRERGADREPRRFRGGFRPRFPPPVLRWPECGLGTVSRICPPPTDTPPAFAPRPESPGCDVPRCTSRSWTAANCGFHRGANLAASTSTVCKWALRCLEIGPRCCLPAELY